MVRFDEYSCHCTSFDQPSLHGLIKHKWKCFSFRSDISLDIRKPCEPSPCGTNAICRESNGVGSCSCLQDYIGDPYEGCRPECTQNSDCSKTMACMGLKCRDPCPGTCGLQACCETINHIPACSCNPGYTGNPFNYCTPVSVSRKISFCLMFCNRCNRLDYWRLINLFRIVAQIA